MFLKNWTEKKIRNALKRKNEKKVFLNQEEIKIINIEMSKKTKINIF